VIHRVSTVVLHILRSLAVQLAAFKVNFAVLTLSSACTYTFCFSERSCFCFPWGFQSSACLVLLEGSFRRECLIQRHFKRIYLPFGPDKVMIDSHCWEKQQSSISVFCLNLSLTHGHTNLLSDNQVCIRIPPICTPCTALEWPADNHLLELHQIFDTQQCKTIMTLSYCKEKQTIRDTVQKCFLQDFRTIFLLARIDKLGS
jgi:hypothetical protein